MAFQYAEANSSHLIDSGTIATLSPGPTYVEYPERFQHNVRYSVDGAAVVQAPIVDNRERSWVWARYRVNTPGYTELYLTLLNMHYKLRLNATPAKSPYMFLKEDVTDNLATLTWDAGDGRFEHNNDFVRVKVTGIDQQVERQGGIVIYATTTLKFVIDDTNWNTY